ncbi:hypothetical protein CMUS01_01859 [Colletotrichum musicola]|uniref:Peroxisomal adenine nucleotide transporter 1 n=1 Tax=Colletotrichum musicola TaxID=2175873 RepID=A0A8H6NW90_9PEZI|nr:hypothetical protein CMUS01_01859 [Colletotrichum musicola]
MPDNVLNALGHALAGATGTAFSTAAVYPLDLVTTRLKVQRQLRREDASTEKEQYCGLLHAFKAIATQEGGISALYTGLGHDIFKSIADSFLFFLFYAYFRGARRRARGRKLPALEELAVGALAGACARACTTPIANVVTRKQTSAMFESRNDATTFSVWKTLTTIYADNGTAGLWAGYSASLLLTINPSMTFFLNDKLGKTLLPDAEEDSHDTRTTFLLAAASKAIATILSYPLQTAKARLQIQGSGHSSPSRSTASEDASKGPHSPASTGQGKEIRSGLRSMVDDSALALVISIAKNEGVVALYAGLQGEVLKSFFSHGLTMVSKGIIHKLVVRLGMFLVILMQTKPPSIKLRLGRIYQTFRRIV